jgi:hypothetical protein
MATGRIADTVLNMRSIMSNDKIKFKEIVDFQAAMICAGWEFRINNDGSPPPQWEWPSNGYLIDNETAFKNWQIDESTPPPF